MAPPPSEIKTFSRMTKDGRQYLCTTDPKHIDLAALNATLDSDLIYWAGPLGAEDLKKMVDHSWCISLYHMTEQGQVAASPSNPMIGFARLITDYVTFAYLTDVYVLPWHQERGLGLWMIDCLESMLQTWPGLRRIMLVASSEHAKKMYERVLGMRRVEGSGIMFKLGPGASPAIVSQEGASN